MKSPVDYNCPECGGPIWTECNMYWDYELQKWEPTETPNGLFSCVECDYETKWIDQVEVVKKPTLADSFRTVSSSMRAAVDIMVKDDALRHTTELREHLEDIHSEVSILLGVKVRGDDWVNAQLEAEHE